MANQFTLSGTASIAPDSSLSDAVLSADPAIAMSLSSSIVLTHKQVAFLVLTDPTQTPINMNGIAQANVLIVKTNQPIKVYITSSYGSEQVIPCDDTLILITETAAFTGLLVAAITDANVTCTLGRL